MSRLRKRERNLSPEFRSYSTRARKFLKKKEKEIKKLKNFFPSFFLAKTVLDRSRKRKKKLVPNFVHTRPGQENYEKYNIKIRKIKKIFPA